jgi:1,4-alpha-glucan branching enzyme
LAPSPDFLPGNGGQKIAFCKTLPGEPARASDAYPWHDGGFRTPDFSDMVIYRAHIGTYAIRSQGVASNFLDVASKVPYLAALGINLLQPLPMDEQEANPSMGYGGADLFSPDFPCVPAQRTCRAI